MRLTQAVLTGVVLLAMAAPSVAQTPGGPSPELPPSEASAPAATNGILKKDSVTLADVKNKLTATRDDYWRHSDALLTAKLLQDYQDKQSKLNP